MKYSIMRHVLAAFLLVQSVTVSAVEREALYRVNLDKWRLVERGGQFGDVYLCKPCSHDVMLTLYAAKHSETNQPGAVTELTKLSEDDQENIANHLLRSKLPEELLGHVEYGIDRVGFSVVSGVSVFQYTGYVALPQGDSLETFLVGDTNTAGFSITINYFYGDFDEVARDAVDDVVESFYVE